MYIALDDTQLSIVYTSKQILSLNEKNQCQITRMHVDFVFLSLSAAALNDDGLEFTSPSSCFS